MYYNFKSSKLYLYKITILLEERWTKKAALNHVKGLTLWPELLEAQLALTSVNYHVVKRIGFDATQRLLAIIMLRATGLSSCGKEDIPGYVSSVDCSRLF